MEEIMKSILDEKTKAYLVACLVAGIDVKEIPSILMKGIVDHMNSTERFFWTQGDEDGIIVHDKNDIPLLNILYNGTRMTFTVFDQDEFDALGNNKGIGFALLNVIGYLQKNAYDFDPSILGSEAHVVESAANKQRKDNNPEDWAL